MACHLTRHHESGARRMVQDSGHATGEVMVFLRCVWNKECASGKNLLIDISDAGANGTRAEESINQRVRRNHICD